MQPLRKSSRKLVQLLPFILHLLLQVRCLAQPEAHQAPNQNGSVSMRILALFSSTSNELGIDHRLGRQVLRLAAQRARQLYPSLKLELVIETDDTTCGSTNLLPSRVVEHFYLEEAGSCDDLRTGSANECVRNRQDADLHELELYLNSSSTPSSSSSYQQQVLFQSRRPSSTSQVDLEEATNQRIHAIIGPSCDFLVDLIARMAAYWRTSVYSVTSIGATFARKDIYSTLTRLSPSLDQLSMFLIRTMQRFSWRHLAILADRKQALSSMILDNLERTLARSRYLFNSQGANIERRLFTLDATNATVTSSPAHKSTDLTSSRCNPGDRLALQEASKVARVVLLLVDEPSRVRRLLLCAHELGMNDGEFTFFAINLGLQTAPPVPNVQTTTDSDLSAVEGGVAPPRQSKSTSGRAAQSFDWYLADEEEANLAAREMFQSLMVFSAEPLVSDQYNLFVEQTLEALAVAHPELRFERASIGSTAVALHDSLLLAVDSYLNSSSSSSLADHQLTSAGEQQPVHSARERHYEHGLTARLHINAQGDQELDYVLSDLEPEMGVMRPVAMYSKEQRQIELLPESYIHWPKRRNALTKQVRDNDEPPPDEPECGFTGEAEHCIDRQNLHAALTIVTILALLISVCVLFSIHKYRHIRYQMQLDDYWWKVSWDELQFLQTFNAGTEDSVVSDARSIARAFKSGGSLASGATTVPANLKHNSASDKPGGSPALDKRRTAVPVIVMSASPERRSSIGGGGGTGGAKSVISVGKFSQSTISGTAMIRSEFSSVVRVSNLARYRGELVIVKQLNKSTLAISRELLVELKSMREYLCDNLAKFIGICVEPNRLAIVYEFCSRGSLQDILLNKSVSMDWTLKYSIIGDIVNGLNFIHTTLLDYHGRLKSTNLVLDSRFTVKITDFGLQSLYSQLEAIEDCAEDERDEEEQEEEAAGRRLNEDDAKKAPDSVSRQADQLSMVASAYNMESVSMRGGKQTPGAGQIHKHRNRGGARYFWTAPEHLRGKDVHCSGSKKGDVYSLAVVLSEIISRKEPYYYGSTAKPHWPAIKRVRLDHLSQTSQQQQQQQLPGRRSSQLHSMTSGTDNKSQVGASEVSVGGNSITGAMGRRARRMQSKLLRTGATVAPESQGEKDTPVVASDACSVVSMASSATQQDKSSQQRISIVEELEANESQPPGKNLLTTTGSEQPDAEEILDQLRMGIEPDPVRPYLPNYLLQDVNARLLELMRMCWAEAPQNRPTVTQVRNLLRRITRGVASRNYLDNLLERLQNYAENLEQLVDSKSSDIVAEKQRTEELLYQLVPKFLADRLKRQEPIVPQLFDGVTIFFSDIVGFEKYASVMNPIEQVDLLNSIYSSFDSIISSFDVTKIETIIDQFLVASGISLQEESANSVQQQVAAKAQPPVTDSQVKPQATDAARAKMRRRKRGLLDGMRRSYGSQGSKTNSLETPAEEEPDESAEVSSILNDPLDSSVRYKRSCAEQIGRMALCIRDLVKSFHFRQTLGNLKESGLGASGFNIRIGIHSGKVCAGIVGAKRPKFCLIGDTVNVASRMHTNSKANRIQISASTRDLLEQIPGFSIEPRGKIDVKGKGLMETFWLESSY